MLIADLMPLFEDEFVPHKFLQRMEHVVRLLKRGATAGERQGAEHALKRMQARAEQEMPRMGNTARSAFEQRMRRILGGNGTDTDDTMAKLDDLFRRFNDIYNPPPQPVTRWKAGQSVVHDQPGAPTDGEIGRIHQIRPGTPNAYEMHWFSTDAVQEWVHEDELRDLQVEDVERIRARNAAKVSESAPPGRKAERFIKKHKKEFKKRYGKRGTSVLYATAWKKFGESISIRDYLD